MVMRYAIFWMLIGLVSCSANSNNSEEPSTGNTPAVPVPSETYTLQGTIFGAPNQLIKLQNLPIAQPGQRPQTIILDSARTNASGQFMMEGSTSHKQIAVLVADNNHTLPIVLDNINYTLTADMTNWEATTISGSTESSILNNFLATVRERVNLIQSTRQQNAMQKTEATRKAEFEAMDAFFGYLRNFIDTTSSAVTALYATDMVNPSMDYDFLKSTYAHYQESMSGSPYLARLQQKINAQTYMNQPANDITLPNPQGDTMSLSDLRGKYVLLDFWAAWCRPCRAENPNVVKAYNEYKDDGFTVFSVSLDRTKQAWVQAIEQDGLIWPNHVSELNYWQTQAIQPYGVKSIPATFLIDPDGNIIGKNLRGYALEYTLDRIFN